MRFCLLSCCCFSLWMMNVVNALVPPSQPKSSLQEGRSRITFQLSRRLITKPRLSNNNDDDDDDGWGDEPSSLKDKRAELRQLQQQRDRTSSPSSSSQSTTNKPSITGNISEPEQDLFIPMFTIVSLLGLFGSYGYEMLRLYSRGELYLPWNNNINY